jgi:hypothetical protein
MQLEKNLDIVAIHGMPSAIKNTKSIQHPEQRGGWNDGT